MNAAQKKELATVPTSCRGIMERAYLGNSRKASINGACLRCVGYLRAEVTNCTAYACPLWPVRPYQAGEEIEDPPIAASVAAQERTVEVA